MWRRYLHFWGTRVEADVDDEIGFHLEMRARELMARGLSEPDARAAARRRLGDLEAARAACITIDTRSARRMRRAYWLDALRQDVKYALRSHARQRGWTAVAVLTLALGIGANTAVFSVVNALLLHPLSYPDARRIAIIFQEPSQGNSTGMRVMITPSAPVVRAWREGSRTFEAIEPFATTDVSLQQRAGLPAVVHAAAILPSFAAFAGQRPLLGRGLVPADVGAPIVALAEGAWRARWGSDPGIVGQTVTLDGQPHTVVGVMPESFRLPRGMQEITDLWQPLDLRTDAIGLSVIGRLRAGADRAAAARELDSLAARGANDRALPFRTRLMKPTEMVSFRESLLMLSGAVALVLLIACANVAHLMLARAATRQRELAVRAALGAGRGRLVRQLLTESVMLALAGCAGGMLIGWAGLALLVRLRPPSLSELSVARIDPATLAVTVALSVLTGIAFGIVGALNAARSSTHAALKAGASATTSATGQRRLRAILVVSEIALSTTLLVGATLLVRSVAHLQTRDPGFNAENLYAVQLALPRNAPGQVTAATRALINEFVERAAGAPGVQAVTLAGAAPPGRSFLIGALQIEGEPPPPRGTSAFVDFNGVRPDYFRVMGIRLMQGTTFSDTSEAAAQVIVNEGLAKKYWPGESALGKRLRVTNDGQGAWSTIVGVVADAATGGLTAESSTPLLYVPPGRAFLPVPLVRTSGGADAIPTLRALAAQLDPASPPPSVTSVGEQMRQSIARPRFTMALLAAFSMLALLLAAVGLYGVMAYTVAQRTREIGIRIALGATRRTIARAVLSQGLVLAIVGVVIGLGAAGWGTRLLQRMLYGVDRTDPASFVAGGAVLLATALVACLVPMSRAIAVDPQIAMRAD